MHVTLQRKLIEYLADALNVSIIELMKSDYLKLCDCVDFDREETGMTLLDVVFCMTVYVCTVLVFSYIVALITCRESRKHPTYCRIQADNVYVVYKYIKYRSGGDYETLRFKREKNKWVYVKAKHTFHIKEYVLMGIAAFAILTAVIVKDGLKMGICFGVISIMTYLCISRAIHMRKIWCCKQYLMKKYKSVKILSN